MEYEGGDDNNVEVGVKTPLEGNGDFRNAECIKLLDECDIVVTNPPFSLARAYVQYLREHNKQFIIIGDLNWITYKEIFPMLKNNEVWLGYNSVKEFMQPDGSIKKFGNKLWYTNLDIQKRHEKLILWQRYYDDDGNPLPDAEERYPRYDNYMAINVDKVADIPMDYKPCWFKCGNAESCPFAQEKGMHDAPALCEQPCNGAMGVPITYMDKHNSDEFEVVDANTFISNESVAQKPHGLIKDKDGTITTKLSGSREQSMLESSSGRKCNGIMGVPITFIDKYSPEQFEIVGLAAGNIRGLAGTVSSTGKDGPYINGKLKYGRIFVRPQV